jgi:hypothetical protein
VGNSPGGGVLIEPLSAVPLNNAYQEARANVEDAEQAVCRLATGLVEEVRVWGGPPDWHVGAVGAISLTSCVCARVCGLSRRVASA